MSRTGRRPNPAGAVTAALAAAAVAAIVGISIAGGHNPKTGTAQPPPTGPHSCQIRDKLPDPACTPGVADPAVTEANLGTTICHAGWSRKVRPPRSYTDRLKYQQLRAYGFTGPASAYEEDHLIPISLGGSPTDPRNLWPEPGGSPNPKDIVENAAIRAVCSGRMSLPYAQHAMAADWVALGRQLGLTP